MDVNFTQERHDITELQNYGARTPYQAGLTEVPLGYHRNFPHVLIHSVYM